MSGSPLRVEYLARAVVELVGGLVATVVVALTAPLLLLVVVVGAPVAGGVVHARVTEPYVLGALRKPGWDPHAVPVSTTSAVVRGALLPLLVVVALTVPSVASAGGVADAVLAALLLADGGASAWAVRAVRTWERRTGTALLRAGGTVWQDVLQPGWFVWWWGHTPAGLFLAAGDRPPR